MTDTQTIEAINRHLDAEPTDWTARLELADLYEEAGRLDEARYQRWSAEHKRSPRKVISHWHWWKHLKGKAAYIGTLADELRIRVDGRLSRQNVEADLMRVLTSQGWPAPGVE